MIQTNIYLRKFTLPSALTEHKWLYEKDPSRKYRLENVYSSLYPFNLFTKYAKPPEFEFDPITMIYGGNGSGKSTILNLIAAKLELYRSSRFEKTDFFEDYCRLCQAECRGTPRESKIITSDDVFKRLDNTRSYNAAINKNRKDVREKKLTMRSEVGGDHSLMQLHGLDDYERWTEYCDAASQSTSKFIRDRVERNFESYSNGETALKYLTDEISENALYLLDEPESSLSPAFQIELKRFIEESALYFGCQFIISTHSPLILSAKGAKIYNLDDEASVYEWDKLENVRVFARFFKEHADKFKDI